MHYQISLNKTETWPAPHRDYEEIYFYGKRIIRYSVKYIKYTHRPIFPACATTVSISVSSANTRNIKMRSALSAALLFKCGRAFKWWCATFKCTRLVDRPLCAHDLYTDCGSVALLFPAVWKHDPQCVAISQKCLRQQSAPQTGFKFEMQIRNIITTKDF